jgi:hypothetical protein
MFDVIVSTLSRGQVRRRRLDIWTAAESRAHHIEALAPRFRLALQTMPVERLVTFEQAPLAAVGV